MDFKMILLIIGTILFMTGFAASRLRDKSNNEITTILGVIFLIGGSIVLMSGRDNKSDILFILYYSAVLRYQL